MSVAIVTDIEGTTSSIRFVKDVLFPHAAKHMCAFLETHWPSVPVQTQVAAISEIAGHPLTSAVEVDNILQQWIREDRKLTPLKALQGMIWEEGYKQGEYRAHVYPDAARALQNWHRSGIPLYIYSSGSVRAQKLFFGHSLAGDLTCLFSGYFDTTTGPKKDSASYRKIASAIGSPAQNILFLSDVEAELDAASTAGMKTTLLARPEDSAIKPESYAGAHPAVASFDDIVVTMS